MKDSQIPCLHYQPRQGKMARAAWVLPVVAAGRVQVLNKAGENDWVEDWLNEFVNFPFGRFDDQVDSLVQLIHCERRLFACGGRVEIIY